MLCMCVGVRAYAQLTLTYKSGRVVIKGFIFVDAPEQEGAAWQRSAVPAALHHPALLLKQRLVEFVFQSVLDEKKKSV